MRTSILSLLVILSFLNSISAQYYLKRYLSDNENSALIQLVKLRNDNLIAKHFVACEDHYQCDQFLELNKEGDSLNIFNFNTCHFGSPRTCGLIHHG